MRWKCHNFSIAEQKEEIYRDAESWEDDYVELNRNGIPWTRHLIYPFLEHD